MYPPFGALPTQTSPEKNSQLSGLTNQLPGFRAVNRNQSVLEGPAPLWDGRIVNLRISLSPNFPQDPPALHLSQPVQHPIVDQSGQLKFAGLDNWGPASHLSAIVQEALTTLRAGNSASSAMQPSASSGSDMSKAATAPTDFPELHTFSMERISELLSKPDAYQTLLDGYVEKSQPVHVKKLLTKGNIDLAQANRNREGDLAEVKNQIAIIRSSEYAAAKEGFDTALSRQEEIMKKINPTALIEALGRKASQADEEAEELHTKFINKEITVEAFMPSYTAQKKLFHQRELKQQAAQQIL